MAGPFRVIEGESAIRASRFFSDELPAWLTSAPRSCRSCGCWELSPCLPFGCWWVAESLCSECRDPDATPERVANDVVKVVSIPIRRVA